MAAALAICGCDRGKPAAQPASASDFISAMNAGRLHFLRREQKEALEALRQAMQYRPDSYAARFNFALVSAVADPAKSDAATMEGAIPVLDELLKLDPNNTAALYLAGLTRNATGRAEEAIPFLKRVSDSDPTNVIVRYQYAKALRGAGRREEAAAEFDAIVKMDKYYSPAANEHMQLLVFFKGTDAEEAKAAEAHVRWLKEFEAATKQPKANTMHCAYTRYLDPPNEDQPASSPIPVSLVDATREWTPGPGPAEGAAWALPVCVVPNEAGRPDLAIADTGGGLWLVRGGEGGQHPPVRVAASQPERLTCAIVGDVRHDVELVARDASATRPSARPASPGQDRPEVFMAGPLRCELLSFENGLLRPQTDLFDPPGAFAVDAAWVDVEHDGDVDLLVASPDGSPRLYQNGGSGPLVDMTASLFWKAETRVGRIAAVDFNQDDRVDLLFCGDPKESVLMLGQGLGIFTDEPSGRRPLPPANAMVVNDLDNDGRPDIVLGSSPECAILCQSGAVREALPVGPGGVLDLATIDYDNDGWLDLVMVSDSAEADGNLRLRLWRNVGAQGWQDVTASARLDSVVLDAARGPCRLTVADVDADSDSDLIVAWEGGLRFVRNDGGNANRQIKLQLVGTRSNRSGIGSHVDVRQDKFRASRLVSAIPLEIGIGPRDKVSNVEVVWPNGVTDALVGATAAQPARIMETQTEVGSCPYLYAWDGQGFRFVTDILGNSPLGLPLRRGQMIPADTDEYVWVGGGDALPPVDGRLRLIVTNELREVLYLDKVGLLAVDRLPEIAVVSTDALRPPPFPASEVAAFSGLRPPLRALDGDGNDVTELLVSVDDRKTAPLRMRQPQLRGLAEPHALTLDFGSIDGMSRPALILTGWLQYGDGSVNISAEQNASLSNPSPVLEVELADGSWRAVDANLSLPAGKTKTIFYDLTKRLPIGSRRLRLTTGFQVYWDRISLGETMPDASVARTWLGPARADLQFRGFSRRVRPTFGHPSTPIFDDVSPRPGWKRTLEGWCTRYGDVLPLVMDVDDQYVILNGGDAVTIDFDPAGLPPPRPGYVRDFFFFSDGWDKDSDHNVTAGDTVEPLPYHGQDDQTYGRDPQGLRSAEWMFRYNTRWVGADALWE